MGAASAAVLCAGLATPSLAQDAATPAQDAKRSERTDAARNARAQAQTEQALPTITVRSDRRQPQRPARVAPQRQPIVTQPVVAAERGTGPVIGYTATQSVTATKTDTPILETPQSISVITKDQIAAQEAQTLVQALRYTPGVSVDAFSANTFFDSIKVRGFDAPQYLDGLRLPKDPGTQFAIPKVEPYGLERIEVLKGPSSGLYGQSDPGGLINMISKRPTAKPFAEFVGQVVTFDRFQGAFDIGGPATKDGVWSYRLTGLARESDTQINHVEDNKLFIAPSLTWRPTNDTSFTLLSQYQKINNKGFQQYVPGVGSLYNNPYGRIPYSRYLGEPGVDGYKLEQAAIGYAFEHRFNNFLQFRQNVRYLSVENDLAGVRSEGLLADVRTLQRTINYVKSTSRNLAVDNMLQADLAIGPFAHKVLFGVDYFKIMSTSDYRFAGIAPIDIFNPQYGAPVPSMASLPPLIASDADQRQLGVYIQDQIKFDRWTLSLTGRQDWVTTENTSRGLFPPPGSSTVDDKAFTGRAAMSYLFDFGLAPYVSYSTSFVPVTGTTAAGTPFKPLEGEGTELGVKYMAPGTNLMLTASIFDIKQKNVLTGDPNDINFNVQTGEVTVQGVEFEARGNLSRNLEIVGGVSFLDPRVTASNNGLVGNRPVNVAVNQASLWGMYTFLDGPAAGFGIGGGIRYVGESYADDANRIRIPDYTLYDAALSYDFGYLRPEMKGVKAQLNATNLFNKYYVASCVTSVSYCGLGAARTVMLTMKYTWQ